MSETTTPARRGRPPASSRQEIEAIALELFLDKGFADTTLASITAAARVSKTSFFRYFPSKADIVWSAFDGYAQELAQLLTAAVDAPGRTMDLVRSCVVGSVDASIDGQGLWMRRFRVLEGSPELRAEKGQQWSAWTAAVSGFVADRHGLDPADVVPQAVGSAVHSGYLAVLRSWIPRTDPGRGLLSELDERLRGLTDAQQAWLDSLVVPAPRESP